MITLGWVQDSGRFDKLHRVVQALASRGETRRADFLELIREVIEDLKGPDADYPTVEKGLEEIERILNA